MIAFLDSASTMEARILEHAWSETALGPSTAWPIGLKLAVGQMIRAGLPQCLCWGPEMITLYNDAFQRLLGNKGDCLGKRYPEIWPEVWSTLGPIAENALRGTTTTRADLPLQIDRGNGGLENVSWTLSCSAVVDAQDHVCGFTTTIIDTTARTMRERDATIRNDELQHRIKNFYAVVNAIISQTFRGATDLDEVRAALVGRIQALSRAQEILSLNRGASDTLGAVVSYALSPMCPLLDKRVFTRGPNVLLSDQQAFSMALAVHELLTNSVKYGALSHATGQVHINWTLDASNSFRFEWREIDGPPVKPPEKSGFGSFLITESLAAAFAGEVNVDFAPSGLVLRLLVPVLNGVPEKRGRSASETSGWHLPNSGA